MSFEFISRSRDGGIEDLIFLIAGREILISLYVTPTRSKALRKFIKDLSDVSGKDIILAFRLKDNDDRLTLNYSGMSHLFALEISGTDSGIYFPKEDTENIINWLKIIEKKNS